jgi:pullulanase
MVNYEQFGARDDGGRIRFEVFIPGPRDYEPDRGGDAHIESISVYGTFQAQLTGTNWDQGNALPLGAAAHEGGTRYTTTTLALEEAFYEYKFIVGFDADDGFQADDRVVNDPCARYAVGERENSGVVVGGSSPGDNSISALGERLPPSDLVIYELFIDDFTDEYRAGRAPVDAVVDKLDRIVQLGFNAIEFMPWTSWVGGAFNWGYMPYQYYSVEYAYVHDPADEREQLSRLKALISACHERGLHVIMDAVFNHVEIDETGHRGFAYHWLWRNPADCPFTGRYAEAGYGTEMDFHNACTEEFIVGSCRYWIDTFGVDGLRLDFTKGYYGGSAEHGLPKVIAGVREHLAAGDAERRDAFPIVIEHLTGWDAIHVANTVDATGCWADEGYWRTRDYLRDGVDARIMRWLDSAAYFEPGRMPVMYIGNHDHETPAHYAGGRDRWHRLQPYLIALFTSYGMPMLYHTEDGGQDEWMPEDDRDSPVKRVSPRPKRWSLVEDGLGRWIGELLGRLAAIRRDHPVLRAPNMYPASWPSDRRTPYDNGYGIDTDRQTVVYHRWGHDAAGALHRYVIVLNFGPTSQPVAVPLADGGTWTDLINGAAVTADDGNALHGYVVESHWGHVFHKAG